MSNSVVHLDLLGRPVAENDMVAYSHHNSLEVGRVSQVNPKTIRIVPVRNRIVPVRNTGWRGSKGILKYSSQCVHIGGPELTAWILKNA
jgi:hypothetical protein